jgi:hypothetical protein
MSVDGYLGPNRPKVGQPKAGEDGVVMAEGPWVVGRAPDGVCYRESVQQMIEEMKNPEWYRKRRIEDYCGSEFYESVEDYDPVLAWHCRIL